MKRQVSLEEISDGKLYGGADLVKADCQDCKGCSACCHGMGESIVLDPRDVFDLCRGLSVRFEDLLAPSRFMWWMELRMLPKPSDDRKR